VDLLTPGSRLYWVPRHPAFAYERFRLLRSGAAQRLALAAEQLPAGLRLAVVEGWRHPEIQRQMHAATRARFEGEHPEWTPRQVSRATNRFSAPMDRRVPPPHTTGGAVDVHLVDEADQILDFHSPYALFDRRSAPALASGLSPEAERNRAILREAMLASGFTNYPAEWWHWSYGDQAWAYRGGHPAACYAAIEPAEVTAAHLSFKNHETLGF
jgi:D-alanyl-D-alanine dipeptidase